MNFVNPNPITGGTVLVYDLTGDTNISRVLVDDSFKSISHLKANLKEMPNYKDVDFEIRFTEKTQSYWLSCYYTADKDAIQVFNGKKSTTPASDNDPLQYEGSMVYFVHVPVKTKTGSATGQTDSSSAASDPLLAAEGYVVIE